jgi:stress response protein YsnF
VPVNRIVGEADLPASRYEGDTLIVPILEEVLVVEKRYRIKEELHIIRHRREHRHAETVTLKSEEVAVEWFDDSSDVQKPDAH